MIIDIHAHTTNGRLPHMHTKSATIADLEELALKHGIIKIVLMATYFPFKKTGLKNHILLCRIEDKNLFSAMGSLDVMNNFTQGLAELTKLCEEQKIVGIKLYPGYQRFDPSDPAIFPIYELAQQYNLPVMFHGGELYGCCRSEERQGENLKCGATLCPLFQLQHLSHPMAMRGAFEAFPKVKFIVSHLANPYFDELRRVMIDFKNVFTDISGQFVSGGKEDTKEYRLEILDEIRKFLDLPDGERRVMFGTDYPIQSYEDSLDLVKRLKLSAITERRLLFKNALFVLNQNVEVI